MRPRRLLIALLCCSALIAAAIFFFAGTPDLPLDVRFVETAGHGNINNATVEFRLSDESFFINVPSRVEARVAGKWQPPQDFNPLEDSSPSARTNWQRVVLAFPAQADACRFSLTYSFGGLSACRARGFLCRHGIYQKFPKFSDFAVRCIRRRPHTRHVEYELSLQPKDQDHLASASPNAS